MRGETRELLVRKGADIVARHGFNHTGINAVLTATGVPKGSFYYYFSSKEDFGLAVIDALADDYRQHLERLLRDAGRPPLERLRRYFAAGIDAMQHDDFCRGCPIGNLGQELAAQNDRLRARLDGVFMGWQRQFEDCLEEARHNGEIASQSDVAALAAFLLAGWEGAILRAKVTRSVEPMEVFADLYLERILAWREPTAA